MLGTGLGHTVLVTSWRYTIHWLHTDAAGWAGQSTVVGGHTTPAPGTQGAWSLVTTLSRSPGGRMTWATWVTVSSLCSVSPDSTLLASLQCSSVSLHVSVSQGAWPSPHYPPHSAHTAHGCWYWAPAPASLTHGAATTVPAHCTGLGQGPPTLMESSQPRPLSLGESLSLSHNLSRGLGLEAGGGSWHGIGPWCWYFRPWKLTLLTHTKT